MVCGHLATVNGVHLAHPFFDKGMPGLAEHRLAAPGPGNILGVPGQPRVVHDPLGSQLGQEGLSEQPYNVVALDEMAGAVEEETAVKIAVPGDAKIRLLGDHAIGCSGTVFDQQWIGDAIGEMAIRFVMHLDELEGQVRLQCVHHSTRAAITRRAHNFQRLERRDINIGQ